jgi:hypothetical protein
MGKACRRRFHIWQVSTVNTSKYNFKCSGRDIERQHRCRMLLTLFPISMLTPLQLTSISCRFRHTNNGETKMSASNTQFSSETKMPQKQQLAGRETLFSDVDETRLGLRGAMVIAAIAVALLFLGWLAFYFLLFMQRGSVG